MPEVCEPVSARALWEIMNVPSRTGRMNSMQQAHKVGRRRLRDDSDLSAPGWFVPVEVGAPHPPSSHLHHHSPSPSSCKALLYTRSSGHTVASKADPYRMTA